MKESDIMSVISVRTTEEEKKIMKAYAEFFGMTLCDFLKTSAIEKIEDMLDMQAVEEYEKSVRQGNNKTYTHDEVLEELGLK